MRSSRKGLCITTVVVCHLLATLPLLTSQVTNPAPGIASPQTSSAFSSEFTPDDQAVTIAADRQEEQGNIFKLTGHVEIDFRTYTVRADQITYDKNTGELTMQGHIALDGGDFDQHITADHGHYNVKSQTGEFFNVLATTGGRFRGHNVALTTSSPFTFTGDRVEQIGPRSFVIHHGTVTSCELPKPKWTFNAERISFEIGDEAKIFNSTFRIRRVPVFFFPYAQHPVESVGRKSGFLIPTIGQSSRKGTILGESAYLTLGRSADVSVGAELYSKRGFAQHGEVRVKPSARSNIDFNYFGVIDRGLSPGNINQGGEDVNLNADAEFAHGIRGVASAEYLSRFIFRLAFTENFSQAVNSEVKSFGFLSKSHRGFSANLFASRYQNFQSTNQGDFVTILHVPSFQASTVDRYLFGSKLMWGAEASAEGVSRRSPTFSTSTLVGRFDVHPRIALPLFLRGWSFRPELAARNTAYNERLVPNGGAGTVNGEGINRRDIETAFEMRPPTLVRVFDKPLFGQKVKHTFEPRIIYRYVNGIDNFQQIIRFDSQDTLSDTNELEYAITNRLYLKPASEAGCDAEKNPACVRSAREVITWEIAQKYFFNQDFGGALVPGRRNALATTEAFTGIAFLTEPRLFSPVVSRLRIHMTSATEASWQLDYDTKKGRVSSSNLLVDHRIGDFFFGGSHTLLKAPGEIFLTNNLPAPDKFNQFRVLVGYGNPGKRGLSAAANTGFDANFNFLQYSALQTSYNWDCCGLSFEYRRFALGSVRNENQYRFAFNLANIGTFGNLKRQERLF